MKIGTFRIARAKKIPEITPSSITTPDITKEISADKENINVINDIDIHAVLRNYQEIYFLSETTV